MEYDFDTVIERRNTGCEKWNVAENELPMWVADMDFQTAPEILDAVEKRAAHGIFGYQNITQEWYEAYINWWKMRHDFLIKKEWLMFCSGVVPAISSMIRKLTTPAEKILIQPPVYHVFFHCISDSGRQVAENPLLYDGNEYQIDFKDLEQKLSDPQTTLMILSNPHNPVGKIWSREDLERIGELCKKYHVTVISDEIHCDITDPGCCYTPFASISETCRDISITCIAPTKTFNIAGLQTSAVFVSDEVLRHKVRRAITADGISGAGVFSVEAAVAAFTKGADWLDALRRYIYQNKKTVEEFLQKELPEVKLVPGQATYLLWLDCNRVFDYQAINNPVAETGTETGHQSATDSGKGIGIEAGLKTGIKTGIEAGIEAGIKAGIEAGIKAEIKAGIKAEIKEADLSSFIRQETGLYLSNGKQFGTNGKQFMRMNIACPKSMLMDGLNRLKEGVKAYEKRYRKS